MNTQIRALISKFLISGLSYSMFLYHESPFGRFGSERNRSFLRSCLIIEERNLNPESLMASSSLSKTTLKQTLSPTPYFHKWVQTGLKKRDLVIKCLLIAKGIHYIDGFYTEIIFLTGHWLLVRHSFKAMNSMYF